MFLFWLLILLYNQKCSGRILRRKQEERRDQLGNLIIQWVYDNFKMENQKSSIINPLLSQTYRHFYTRRVPQRSNSNAQVQKVLKLLNCTSNEKRQNLKVKTEQKEETPNIMKEEIENLRKMAKAKAENAVKREGRQWKQLLDNFWTYSKSTSKECLLMNEINFLLKMVQIVKKNNRISENAQKTQNKDSLQYRLKEQKLQLENIKLQKEVQMLNDILQFKENEFKTINASINLLSSQRRPSKFKNVEEEKQERVRYEESETQRELEIIKHANDLLRQQKKSLQEKIDELKLSNQNLCEQIIKDRYYSLQNKQKFEMWSNIMNMQNEQITSLKLNIVELRKSLSDLTKKYQNMLRRISKISDKDQSRLMEITKRSVEIFTEQIESFQRVRSNFIAKGYFIPHLQNGKDTNTHHYRNYFNQKETINNPQGVKKGGKQTLRYFKPTFYVYLEKYFEYQGVDKENFQKIDLAVGVDFLATLRSILDSKYNQYLLSRKPSSQFSSLSNFTLSWLSNFTFDLKTKKQEHITTDVCFETIGSFYVRLMCPYLNSNWQAITFRQFLLDTLTLDELMFYLKARDILMKGDTLKGSGAFTEIIYVSVLDALFLIQLVVSDFDYRKKLQGYIKRSTEFLRKKQLIDVHFILRLLIEYYQYKKAQNFSSLTKAFYVYIRQKNHNMPFENYLKIYDYISLDLTLIQKLEIYQKAFSLGRGIVYLQNIFTVINEQGYFYNEVQKMFEKKTMIQDNLSHERHIFVKQYEFPQCVQNLANILQKKILPQSASLGVEWVKKVLNQQKIVRQRMPASIFGQAELTFQISLFYIKKLVDNKWLAEQDLLNILPNLTNFLQLLVKMSIQKKNSIHFMQKFLKNHAARQILRLYRKKRLINRSILNTSIDPGEKKKQKSEEIKKQFNTVIQLLKKKFLNQPRLTSQVEIQQ